MIKTRRRVRFARLMTLPLAMACAVACDSSFDDFGFGAVGGTGFAVDSGTAQVEPSPCDLAKEGASCSTFSSQSYPMRCEIGEHPNPRCNPQLRCISSVWKFYEAERDCEQQVCPSAFATPPPDAGCELPETRRLLCNYFDGTCGCAPPAIDGGNADGDGGVQDGGEEAGTPDDDAGDGGPDGGVTYMWQCLEPEPECPRIRPRLGETCVKPICCDYGVDRFDEGVAVRCEDQFWAEASFTCHR